MAERQDESILDTTDILGDSDLRLLGRDIQWSDITGHVFRVRGFDRSDTAIAPNGSVHANSMTQPYGYLLVESPILNQLSWLPICHRDDFLLTSSVFDEPRLAPLVEKAELLVTYMPKRKSLGTHVLHYVIAPSGTLRRYYAKEGISMQRATLLKLFRQFVYEGEIKVEVNPDPDL